MYVSLVELIDRRREGVGEEPNHTTSRSITYSLVDIVKGKQ
jgi:hypothetical protein